MFGTKYRNLAPKQKVDISAQSYHDQQWRVAHIDNTIYSTACLNTVEHPSTQERPPCANCWKLLRNQGFKKAVRRPAKNPENLRYTNRRFLNTTAALSVARTKGVAELLQEDSKRTLAARFAAKVVLDPNSDQTVFSGLVHAVVMQYSKQVRGVGLQNSTYSSSYDDFCHMILAHSPSAYHTFRTGLPGRVPESFRQKRSRDPKFPLSIDEGVSKLAKTYLEQVKYTGPVCLSCDDTKLLPSLQAYYDGSTQKWMLVGGANGPIKIEDNEDLVKTLKNGVDKATKLRLFTLQVPLQGIAPLAIAALPIPSNVSASTLANHLKTILDSLIDAQIMVTSYASDGSIVEQNVQALVFKSAPEYQDYLIPCKTDKTSNIWPTTFNDSDKALQLAFYRGHPLVMVQDSKHALKTCRNNLFSGARLLVLGDHVIHYSQVREIAFDQTSTLYHRDVEKLDRQDDHAASRLFCAATLDFVMAHRPKYLGLAVYLFLMGELGDAWQSRCITHAERFKMAMRTSHFLQFWEKFLHDSGYPTARYFISREASSILTTVINGLVLLMIVYRDHLDSPQPLIPWLHSTEPCEHMFGELRKINPDFSHRDVLFAMPKLRTILRASYQAGLSAKLSAPDNSQPKKATGYHHSCADSIPLDTSLFYEIPTLFEMSELSFTARIEAANMARALGIEVQDYSPVESQGGVPSLVAKPELETSEDWAVKEVDQVSPLEVLQELFSAAESSTLPLHSTSRQRDNVVYATSALGVEQFNVM
ncbi:hypothetical protein BDV93DRAFT_489093 [Ceratobasidium sp. AG-I]|nr:hypothetical protein BDV93DRAFT_489093 [Ceratobasidium sp. AG-I]